MSVWAKCMRLLDSALPVLYSIPPNIFCGEVPNDKIIRVLHISLFAVGILKKFWHFPIPCRCNTYCFHIDNFQYFGRTPQSSDRKVFRVSPQSQSHCSLFKRFMVKNRTGVHMSQLAREKGVRRGGVHFLVFPNFLIFFGRGTFQRVWKPFWDYEFEYRVARVSSIYPAVGEVDK